MDDLDLSPQLDLLGAEYVLVQAWKKTSAHIRAHNWYADTLELDRVSVNLPRFLEGVAARLHAGEAWTDAPLRMVPAPKSQRWHVDTTTRAWTPADSKTASRLRPLAHVAIEDQVAATALLLCLADRVETRQGDPRATPRADTTIDVVSYGNRLFCDATNDRLRHRWGSAKLYRAYYQDYRAFLARPDLVADGLQPDTDTRLVVVHSDLKQFYDRVTPRLLFEKIQTLREATDDPRFYETVARVLNWRWHPRDDAEVRQYATAAGIEDFSEVALPQGLVASGFFANVVLLDFDDALRARIGSDVAPGLHLHDVARYVDDLRFVLTVDRTVDLRAVEQAVFEWLSTLLMTHAAGLEPSREKTRAAALRSDERPWVRQSRKMARIQSAVSGGFDAWGGEEILDAVQGLLRSQERYSEDRSDDGWSLSPVADVRDATVARFAAGRYRSTYRSLRPLLDDVPPDAATRDASGARDRRTRGDLDEEARAFALGLIENWVTDPSNVRLLRIALDLWPAPDVAVRILDLLRPFTTKGGRRKGPRRVAWYCLSEIFRAGATETGIVDDDERLPADVDVERYRAVLLDEAVRLLQLPSGTLPWYLRQQALLFLAAVSPADAPITRRGSSPDTKHYRELILFLRGEHDTLGLSNADFASLAVLARRGYRSGIDMEVQLQSSLGARRIEQIAERDPSFAVDLLRTRPDLVPDVAPRVRDDLCLTGAPLWDEHSLAARVLSPRGAEQGLRSEWMMLQFADRFLEKLDVARTGLAAPPDVIVSLESATGDVSEVSILPSRVAAGASLYRAPSWASDETRWRFHLGYLLRFIAAAQVDFARSARRSSWRDTTRTYRAPESHWYQRLYGLSSGQHAWGDDWVPISEWMERLLSTLLAWPGCRSAGLMPCVTEGLKATREAISARSAFLRRRRGQASGVHVLEASAPWPVPIGDARPLRIAVAQTVVPGPTEFQPADLTLSAPAVRRRHRNHLASALAAIERMLQLRETHKGLAGRRDWLILPELAVHPHDIRTHIVPFVRAHRCIVLCGVTYEQVVPNNPLVNSAMWVIPERSESTGLRIRMWRQGKQHLAPPEQQLNVGTPHLTGFRPCQWIVNYKWSADPDADPLRLTASVCYDATDISLASDLRVLSDVYAIPALNKDVFTFDQMALALHYHMYQLVVIANNGTFGGSNAYAPYKHQHSRQVFHTHGQPQASISFLEIENVQAFLSRLALGRGGGATAVVTDDGSNEWKYPPAGF